MTTPLGHCEVSDCYNFTYEKHGYCDHHWNLMCAEDEKNENILKMRQEIELLKNEIKNLNSMVKKNE